MVSTKLIIIGIILAYIGNVVYNIPIPVGMSEPHKLRLSLAISKLVFQVVQFLDFVGVLPDYTALRWFRRHKIVPTDGVQTQDITMDGVDVRVYIPENVSLKSKAMVYYHGGGWVLGTINTHDAVTSYFAKEANMVVVSVEYRLTPEYSKTDGLNDCITATKHLIKNAAKFGIDPERVVVAGDSAGGNFAAAVVLHLRDKVFSPMPKLQLLIYPCVQGIDLELPSYQQNSEGPILPKTLINWFMSHITARNKRFMSYFRTHTHVPSEVKTVMAKRSLNHDLLPNEYKYPPYQKPNYQHGGSDIWMKIKGDFMDPYFFPLMADDHSELPEAYIFTAHFDPLRDEGYLYAEKLRRDGVKVTLYNYRYGWHGMVNAVLKLRDATFVMDEMIEFLNEKL